MLNASKNTNFGSAATPAAVNTKSGRSLNNLLQLRTKLPNFLDFPPRRPDELTVIYSTTNFSFPAVLIYRMNLLGK